MNQCSNKLIQGNPLLRKYYYDIFAWDDAINETVSHKKGIDIPEEGKKEEKG
jgi:hypothetical protein